MGMYQLKHIPTAAQIRTAHTCGVLGLERTCTALPATLLTDVGTRSGTDAKSAASSSRSYLTRGCGTLYLDRFYISIYVSFDSYGDQRQNYAMA